MRVNRRLGTIGLGAALVLLVISLGAGTARAAQTFMVTVAADTGAVPGCTAPLFTGSLRQCVAAANALGGTNTITFAPALNGVALMLTSGELAISNQTLSITGNGRPNTIIDGNKGSRVFEVMSTATVSMTDLTVRNGVATNSVGGGIWDHSALTLTSVDVTGNTSTNSSASGNNRASGGGVEVDSTASLVMKGGSLTNNRADSTAGTNWGGVGGGVGTYLGSVTISDATIDGNSVSGPATRPAMGPDADVGPFGGGVGVCCGSSRLTIARTTITNNSVAGAHGSGGAVAECCDASVMSIDSSTINGNSVTGPNATGGGVSTCCNNSSATVTGGRVTSNTVTGASAFGGGLSACCDSSTLRVINVTVSENQAIGAGAFGGGLEGCCGTATVSVSGSTFDHNSVSGDHAYGGGIAGCCGPSSAIDVTNSTIAANTASGSAAGGGGAAAAIFNRASANAGVGVMRFTNVTLAGNTAPLGGNLLALGAQQTLSLVNTIVSGSGGCAVAQGGAIQSLGHNLDSGGTCGLTMAGDIGGRDPGLGALQLNAPGSTQTMAIGTGSPAVDAAAAPPVCPGADQRGIPRPQGSACDIGAFELEQSVTPAVPPSGGGAPPDPAFALLGSGIGLVLASASGRRRR